MSGSTLCVRRFGRELFRRVSQRNEILRKPGNVFASGAIECRRFAASATSADARNDQADSNGQDWRDFCRFPEYNVAWTNSVEPLEDDPVLDRQTMFVLHLLQRFHQVGLTRTADRVTTERVHDTLQQLESMRSKSTRSMWQRAERARALLEAMEQFEPLRDEPNLPLPLPLPTHETYWRVLKLYGSKYLHGAKELERDVPEICESIVRRMHDSRRLELQPTAMHWNYVLSAHANSSDEERPFNAAQLLHELDALGLADASSFSHTLRCCVALSARHQVSTPRFEQMAVPVAMRVWKGLQQSSSIEKEPFHFVHMLRVCRNLHELESRDELANTVFLEATEAQQVNVHVLNELLQVASPKLAQQILGKKDFSKDPLKLIQQVPTDWIERVDGEVNPKAYDW